MSELLQVSISQGIFCGLFVWLLLDTRKDTKEREIKYQETIEKNQGIIKELSGVLPEIKDDIEDIKEKIFK